MSFGKLLAAGRSIMNGRASVAYRENKRVYLPKFEPLKHLPPKPAPVPGNLPSGAPVKLAVVAPGAGRPGARGDGWSARLNPMERLREAMSGPVRPVTAVQTELRLDSVKVLHNDLSDAEVEVVPLKSRPVRPDRSAEPEPASAWNELGTGLFDPNPV
jgi:hypothetical protein